MIIMRYEECLPVVIMNLCQSVIQGSKQWTHHSLLRAALVHMWLHFILNHQHKYFILNRKKELALKELALFHLNSTQRCNTKAIITLYFSHQNLEKKQALGLFHHKLFPIFNTLQDDWTIEGIKKSKLLVLVLVSLASRYYNPIPELFL